MSLHPCFLAHSSWKSWSLHNEVSLPINELSDAWVLLNLDWLPRQPTQWLEVGAFSPIWWPPEMREGWKWGWSLMTSELINHTMYNEASTKTETDGVQLICGLVNKPIVFGGGTLQVYSSRSLGLWTISELSLYTSFGNPPLFFIIYFIILWNCLSMK